MSINQYLKSSTTAASASDESKQRVILRDYQHASRIFVSDNYRLSPKYSWLFYVEFDLNPLITSISNLTAQELGMIVKSVTLPKFTIDTKIHNAYNRKNIVQNKINYDPVTIVFHDDQSDNVRNFWYDYYSFYYRDPDYADSTYNVPSKYYSRPSFDWGYSPRPTVGYNNANGVQPYQYIQAIRIYSLYQKNFSQYELINPTITSFRHGDHANGDNTGLMSHEMSVQFETVKYFTGYTTSNTVGGYIDLHYDNTPSPIAPDGGTNLVVGSSGQVTNATDQIQDLAAFNILNTTFANFMNNGATVISGRGDLAAQNSAAATNSSSLNALVNSGGFGLPSLGSLTSGVTSGAVLTQQINAFGASLLGGAAGAVAQGAVAGLQQGLGPNGKLVVGLAAAALTNPKLLLATVENMAIAWAEQQVANFVTNRIVNPLVENYVTPFFAYLGEQASAIGDTFVSYFDKIYNSFGSTVTDQVAPSFLNSFGVPNIST